MKKRIIIALSVLCLFVLALASCGGHEHAYKAEWEKDATDHWHKCEVAGEECSEVSEKASHTFEVKSTTAASCDAKGSKVELCTVCGYEKATEIAALGHDLNEEVIAPTCQEIGITKISCKREGCEYTAEKDPVSALNHDLAKNVVAPTCTADGYTELKCSRCPYNEKTAPTAKVDHTYVEEVIAPTCTKMGVTKVTCANCDFSMEKDEKDVIPHSFYKEADAAMDEHYTVLYEPSCTESGVGVYICVACGYASDDELDKFVIDATGHNFKTIEPWCGNGGMLEKKCTNVCDGVACTETSAEPVEGEYKHTYGEVEIPATCSDNATYKCEKCEGSFVAYDGDELGQKTGEHNYSIAGEVVPPTCIAEGYTVYSCSNGNCGTTENKNIVEKGSHSFGIASAQGMIVCTVCEKGYVDITAEVVTEDSVVCICGGDPCTCGAKSELEGYAKPKAPEAITANTEFVKTEYTLSDGNHALAIGYGVIVLSSEAEANYRITVYATADGEALGTIEVSGSNVSVDLYKYETVGKVVITSDSDAAVSFYKAV